MTDRYTVLIAQNACLETVGSHRPDVALILCLEEFDDVHRNRSISSVLDMNPFHRPLLVHRKVELILILVRCLLPKARQPLLLGVIVSRTQDIVLVLF